LIVELPVE